MNLDENGWKYVALLPLVILLTKPPDLRLLPRTAKVRGAIPTRCAILLNPDLEPGVSGACST